MSETEEATFPLRLTEAQRRVIAGLAPHLQPRLLLDQANERTPRFTLAELKEIARVSRAAGDSFADRGYHVYNGIVSLTPSNYGPKSLSLIRPGRRAGCRFSQVKSASSKVPVPGICACGDGYQAVLPA